MLKARREKGATPPPKVILSIPVGESTMVPTVVVESEEGKLPISSGSPSRLESLVSPLKKRARLEVVPSPTPKLDELGNVSSCGHLF